VLSYKTNVKLLYLHLRKIASQIINNHSSIISHQQSISRQTPSPSAAQKAQPAPTALSRMPILGMDVPPDRTDLTTLIFYNPTPDFWFLPSIY